jgi:hypothetical protein
MTQLSTAGLLPRGGLRMTPARRLTLALGVPLVLALIAWTGFNVVTLVSQASFPVSYTVLAHDGQVNVGLNSGNITVLRGQGGTSRLTGTVQYTLFRPSVSMSTPGGRTQVGVNCNFSVGNCGLNATLAVPAQTAVTVSSGGGDASVSGLDAPVTLTSQGGNLAASDLKGDLHLDSGGGDLAGSDLSGDNLVLSAEGGNITANNVQGDLQLDTGGGDLAGSGMVGRLLVSTEGGNIDENDVAVSTVNAQSGGGDVTLTFAQAPTNVQITADGGNVTIILPPGSAKYDILTPGTDGGNVSYPDGLASSSSRNMITVNSGGGDVSITQGPAGLSAP